MAPKWNIGLAVIGTTALCGMSASVNLVKRLPVNISAEGCETIVPQVHGNDRVFDIGSVWAGVHTDMAAAEPTTNKLVAAYYDADRWLTVVSADAATGRVCRVRLADRFSGWDGHNSLALAAGSDGTVHVAGDAHASPLFYAKGFVGNINSIQRATMVGRDESQATYPSFHRNALGQLIFLYRSGGSGNGTWIANRWTGRSWQRLGAVFAAVDSSGSHVSAYPSPFVLGPNGVNHVAIVWRKTPDVATNFAVGYATSRDFQHWSGTGGGAPTSGPVRPDQIDIIDQPGEHSGLLNNAKLLLTTARDPVVFYTRYGSRGTDALIAARRIDKRWQVKEIATSGHRTPVEGEGSLPLAPTFSVSSTGNIAQVSVAFPSGPRMSFQLDLTNLEVLRTVRNTPAVAAKAASPLAVPAGLANASVWSQLVTASGYDGHSKSHIYWYAQGLNRDHAWLCTPAAPRACAPPPSPLLWVVPANR